MLLRCFSGLKRGSGCVNGANSVDGYWPGRIIPLIGWYKQKQKQKRQKYLVNAFVPPLPLSLCSCPTPHRITILIVICVMANKTLFDDELVSLALFVNIAYRTPVDQRVVDSQFIIFRLAFRQQTSAS